MASAGPTVPRRPKHHRSRSVAFSRRAYLDHLRATLVLLLIADYAATKTMETSGWSDRLPAGLSAAETLLAGVFLSMAAVAKAFVVGSLFLISGYGSLLSFHARQSISDFLKSRTIRLFIPGILAYLLPAAWTACTTGDLDPLYEALLPSPLSLFSTQTPYLIRLFTFDSLYALTQFTQRQSIIDTQFVLPPRLQYTLTTLACWTFAVSSVWFTGGSTHWFALPAYVVGINHLQDAHQFFGRHSTADLVLPLVGNARSLGVSTMAETRTTHAPTTGPGTPTPGSLINPKPSSSPTSSPTLRWTLNLNTLNASRRVQVDCRRRARICLITSLVLSFGYLMALQRTYDCMHPSTWRHASPVLKFLPPSAFGTAPAVPSLSPPSSALTLTAAWNEPKWLLAYAIWSSTSFIAVMISLLFVYGTHFPTGVESLSLSPDSRGEGVSSDNASPNVFGRTKKWVGYAVSRYVYLQAWVGCVVVDVLLGFFLPSEGPGRAMGLSLLLDVEHLSLSPVVLVGTKATVVATIAIVAGWSVMLTVVLVRKNAEGMWSGRGSIQLR